MIRLITTFFYSGYLRPAPGTWGSLASLPAAFCLLWLGGPWLLLGASLGVFWLGIWAVAEDTRGQADHDPSEIVIDEVVGQWIALLPVGFGAAMTDASLLALYPGWIAGFALFRLFDILKPGPVGWADRRGDALGVMLDDVIAGVAAAIGVTLLAGLAHGITGL